MAEETRKPSPPYVAYTTFKNTIRSFEHIGNIPEQIDTSLLKSMSGSSQSQFMLALRFFGLIDAQGKSSTTLKELATSDDAHWKPVMQDLLSKHYPEQMPLLHRGSPQQLKESFGDIGGIVVPAARFLIAAAKDAGVPVSPHVDKVTAGPVKPRKAKEATKPENGPNGDGTPPPAAPNAGQASPPPSVPTTSFREKVLAKMPEFDPTWDAEAQKNWLAVLDRLMGMQDAQQ
jgi:hypothetical protein